MKFILTASFLSAIGAHAAADFPAPSTKITFYEDAGCNGGNTVDVLLPSSNDNCISGTYSEKWPTVENSPSLQVAYYTGDGLPESCQLAILQQANLSPGTCGTAIDIINGGTTGSCLKGKLPIQGGTAICCGGKGNGCQFVPSPAKRALEVSSGPSKDVTQVKRSPPFGRLSKRACTFKNSTGAYVTRGQQQITTAAENCPGGSGSQPCSISQSTSITVGSSNTFGVSDSVTVGGDFFVDVQDTVSFSYMYTYSESKSQTQQYTVTVPAGESGYITWTPTIECVQGSFSGDCSWSTSNGIACIPLYVSGMSGEVQGTFSFLQEQ